MFARRFVVTALAAALVTSLTPAVDAINVARITRHGYIVTDDVDSPTYGTMIPTADTRQTFNFIGDVGAALSDVPGFHPGQYLAAMQVPSGGGQALAFYLPIRNDVHGIGQHSSVNARSEVFDINTSVGTAFPLDGFVYLNTLRFYTDPRATSYGRYVICTQEFGHRFGATLNVPPYPGVVPVTDAGSPDAGSDDAALPDASSDATAPDVVLPDVVLADASLPDARADTGADAAADGATDPPLARDALLGRGNALPNGMITNRAHWSYFFNTGGSPMEGNLWTETSPGVFQTGTPTFRFSDFDLYDMGLIPPTDVHPTFLISEPTMLPRNTTRDSPPEYFSRTVTIHGRRVPITIDDVVRANGRRVPAYPDTPRDMDVVWVLLAHPADVDDQLAADFDTAIESCSLGYSTASGDRGHLLSSVPAAPDAGPPDAATDGATNDTTDDTSDGAPAADGGASADSAPAAGDGATDASPGPADAAADGPATPHEPTAVGGCGCRTAPPVSHGLPTVPGGLAGFLTALGGLGLGRARLRRRGSVVRSRP